MNAHIPVQNIPIIIYCIDKCLACMCFVLARDFGGHIPQYGPYCRTEFVPYSAKSHDSKRGLATTQMLGTI
jgi:hypothetical protein